ncbi:MAG: transposase [Lutispora sp.]|nr:transposase [Lutispora sp.]
MARDPRREYDGGIYHVIARGNNKEYIFKEEQDKGYFIKIVKEAIGVDYQLYGYILMDNHYHFIIQRHDKELHQVMHQINNKFSKYFNFKYKRVGHVFQSRYKAILVQDERYLLSLIRYVHRNPVRAGMCKNVSDYKWSSNFFYERNRRSFINIDTVLDMISLDRNIAINLYIEYMRNSEEDSVDFDEKKIIGDDAYEIMMSTRKVKPARKRLDEILMEVCSNTEEFELIKNGSRQRNLTKSKLEYIRKSIEANYTQREIGGNIGISDAAIRELMRKTSETNDKQHNEIMRELKGGIDTVESVVKRIAK